MASQVVLGFNLLVHAVLHAGKTPPTPPNVTFAGEVISLAALMRSLICERIFPAFHLLRQCIDPCWLDVRKITSFAGIDA